MLILGISTSTKQVGVTIGGHEGVLAMGGMGRIEAVVDRPLDRSTVRKCIHDQLARSETPARMFVREARVTGMLQHPGVVPVHDLGVDSEGYLYYTMERVEGRTLASPLMTRDTVIGDTPAWRATSLIVGADRTRRAVRVDGLGGVETAIGEGGSAAMMLSVRARRRLGKG